MMIYNLIREELKENIKSTKNYLFSFLEDSDYFVLSNIFVDKKLSQKYKYFILRLLQSAFVSVLDTLIQNERLLKVKIDNKYFLGRIIPIETHGKSIKYISVLDLYSQLKKSILSGNIVMNIEENNLEYVITLPKNFYDYLSYFDEDSIKITNINNLKQISFVKGNYILNQIIENVNFIIKSGKV